jgi:hypothetical protein
MPITKHFRAALAIAALLTAGSFVSPTFAGPEAISARDKNPIVEIPTACDPKWYIRTGSGSDVDLGNKFSNGLHEFSDFGIFTTDLNIKSRDYDDVYKNWYNISAEVGYAITNHIELFASANYTQADGQIITGSKLVVDSPINPFPFALGFPFTSHFDNYSSIGGELGVRFFLTGKDARIRPFIALSGGATWVDSIGLTAKSDFLDFDFTVYDGPFYDSSVVGTGRAVIGMEYQVIPCRFSVGADIGVRFTGGLDGDDSGFGADSPNSGLAAFAHDRLQMNGTSQGLQDSFLSLLRPLNNNGAERWSMPVSVYGKFRF